MIVDTRIRTALKAGGWRLIAASAMGLFVFSLTESGVAASSLALFVFLFDLVFKTSGLYCWERWWDRLTWGRKLMTYQGCCIWLTGLPASGKTTIAKELEARLGALLIPHDRLDGDVVRKSFCSDLGFTKADRDENIERNSYVASYLSHSGRIAICSFVSPYQEARAKARSMTKNFVEVHVSCALEECERRDATDPNRAGLYAKARAGEIKGFTGIDDPYEEPENPEVVVQTDSADVSACAAKILAYLEGKGYLESAWPASQPASAERA